MLADLFKERIIQSQSPPHCPQRFFFPIHQRHQLQHHQGRAVFAMILPLLLGGFCWLKLHKNQNLLSFEHSCLLNRLHLNVLKADLLYHSITTTTRQELIFRVQNVCPTELRSPASMNRGHKPEPLQPRRHFRTRATTIALMRIQAILASAQTKEWTTLT